MDTAGAGRPPADAVGGVTAVAGAANASDELGAVATRYAELSREAREHAAHARSESTTRAYDADWRDFSSWCARYEQQALPAAHTVANYLTEHAPAWRPATEAEPTWPRSFHPSCRTPWHRTPARPRRSTSRSSCNAWRAARVAT